jgi:hypothetical protein
VTTLVVLGACAIGGAAARLAVAGAVARRVVLVDDATDVARGKALDIRQASAIDGVTVDVVGTSDLGTVVGASAVVLADRAAPAGEHQGDEALRLLAQVRALNPRALVVCAGALQFEVIERMVHERGAERSLIAGSAPEALRSGLIALAALESRTAPRDVSLMLLGRPPQRAFVVWNDASIAGQRATDVLAQPALTKLEDQLPHLWPPGPLALGSAAVSVVRLALTHVAGTPSLFVVPASIGGAERRAVAVATRVRVDGITPIWPVLSPRDRTRMEAALMG